MARDNPMTKAAKRIFFEISTKALQVSLMLCLLTSPMTNIITINIAESSEKYQPYLIAPYANIMTVEKHRAREILCLVVKSFSASSFDEALDKNGNSTP